METDEALRKIQQMSIGEKIAALAPTDKAYVQGYVERAIRDNSKNKLKDQRRKLKENG